MLELSHGDGQVLCAIAFSPKDSISNLSNSCVRKCEDNTKRCRHDLNCSGKLQPTQSGAGVVECGVDGVWLQRRLVPLDRKICRKRWRVVVAQVGVDALGDVRDEVPATLQPDFVAPGVWIALGRDAGYYQLFRVASGHNDPTFIERN